MNLIYWYVGFVIIWGLVIIGAWFILRFSVDWLIKKYPEQ